jgi:hypothetical protein
MGVAWMADQTVVTDKEIKVQVDSFALGTSRHLNPLTGQVLSTAFLFLNVSAPRDVQPPPPETTDVQPQYPETTDVQPPPPETTDVQPQHPEIKTVLVRFTDEPHRNVGEIDGVNLDLYVPIVETQTWWQVLSNGPSSLAADINNTLGVIRVQLLND